MFKKVVVNPDVVEPNPVFTKGVIVKLVVTVLSHPLEAIKISVNVPAVE